MRRRTSRAGSPAATAAEKRPSKSARNLVSMDIQAAFLYDRRPVNRQEAHTMVVAGFDSSDLGPVQTWKKVMTDPRTFFEHMPLAGGFLNPFVFALLVLAVAGAGGAIVQGGGLKACLTTIGVGGWRLCLGGAAVVLL